MSASEERVLGRLFLIFFILCRLPLPILLEGDEEFPLLDSRRRLRPGLEDEEDFLGMEEGTAILLLLLLLADDGLIDILDTLRALGFPVENKSEEEKELFVSSPLSFPPPPAAKSSESDGGDFEGVDNGWRYIESARSLLVMGAADGSIPILAEVCLPLELELPRAVSRKASSPFNSTPTYLVLNTLLSPQILVTLLTFSTNLESLSQINFNESASTGL